jgi:tight adherence protein B
MMTAIAATFVGVLLLVFGAYWVFALRHEVAEHRTLEQRMRPPEPAKKGRLAVPKSQLRERQGPKLLRPIQAKVDQSGLALTVPKLLFFCWTSAFLFGLVTWQLGTPLVLALGVAACGLLPPYWWVRYKAAARMWKFEEQFPEAIDLIARALRAGHAFPTGLSMVGDELGPPVGPEFKLLFELQNFGIPLSDALRAFAQRVPLIDARFFVTAVLTQRDAGGNLSGVLDNLSSVIRERFKVKRQVKVVSAHARVTAAVLMGLPPTVGLALTILTPENGRLMLNDPLGQKMLIGAGLLQATGVFIISKLVKIEY